MTTTIKKKEQSGFLVHYVPILHWLPRYQRRWWRGDIIAGLSVWALTVTLALTYASIIGLPVQTGLYAALAGLALYAVFGSSRHIITGPSVIIATIMGAAVALAGVHSPDEIVAFAAASALVAGFIYLLLRMFRLGWLASFLTGNMLTGFIAGVAVIIAMGQIKAAFGVSSSGTNAWFQLGAQVAEHPQSTFFTLLLGAGAIILLIGIRKYTPRIPAVLVVLLVSVILSSVLDWQALGVATVGTIPSGLPTVTFPIVSLSQLNIVLLAAGAMVFVGFAETDSSAHLSADRYFEPIDANQELLAQSMANIGSGLLSGFCVDGTLGAIVFLTVIGLIRIRKFKRLYHLSRPEFWQAVITAFSVIVIGPLWGVLVGILLSVLFQTRRMSHPEIAVLGRKPGSDTYASLTDHPDYETVPGLVILLLRGSLYYPTTDALRNRIWSLTSNNGTSVRAVILVLRMTYYANLEGADMLWSIKKGLDSININFYLVEASHDVLHLLETTGVERGIGRANVFQSVDGAVQAFLSKQDAGAQVEGA
jgi:MFS superfamily sulfate permease-like transporter